MIVKTMMLSGAVAGLVGMPTCSAFSHNYGLDFPTGLGLHRHRRGPARPQQPGRHRLGALLLAFLDRSSQILDLEDIAKEIVVIMQGVIVLSVVIAYEVVRRLIESTAAAGR